MHEGLARWKAHMSAGTAGHVDPAALAELIDDDAVFYSPVVFTPQRGKALTVAYLTAAETVFHGSGFRYINEFTSQTGAVLEFEAELDGVTVNGIDMIFWNDAGLITEFRVMVRPLKGMNALHAAMARQLEAMQAGS